jgi:hypothetical protein
MVLKVGFQFFLCIAADATIKDEFESMMFNVV